MATPNYDETALDLIRAAFPGRVSCKVSEANERTGLARTSLYRMLKQGRLPGLRLANDQQMIDLRHAQEEGAAA